MYRLALETGVTQSVYHAVAEEGIDARHRFRHRQYVRDTSGITRREHFGWFAAFAATEMAASSERTRNVLGWQPEQRDLLTDLADAAYYANS